MAEVSVSLPSSSRRVGIPTSPSVAIPTSSGSANNNNNFLKAGAFSPVNQNGSFEFDRVLRSGEVNKRSRKTKTWKRFYLVLRPNFMSVYKSRSEEKLLKQLNLADVTAVALLKDPKGRRNHMFGVFSPSRNYHFQAQSDADARAWVDVIKREARVDEDEPVIYGGSPPSTAMRGQSIDQFIFSGDEGDVTYDRGISSSPEPMDVPSSYTTTRDGVRIPALRPIDPGSQQQHDFEYSGAEQGSFSDFSDAGGPIRSRKSLQHNPVAVAANSSYDAAQQPQPQQPRPNVGRNVSGGSTAAMTAHDDERVVFHGYLLCLKSKGGVRQWKRLWTVLRPKNVTFYKDENEYAAQLILPISSILSAVEIDPVSRTKGHCMQIIAEDKSYRFCAPSEEALVRWLGAIKSQLARRKEEKKKKEAATVAEEVEERV